MAARRFAFGAVQRAVGAEIRAGEGRLVLLLFVDLFLLLTAYYVLKVVREPLILLSGGAVARTYARGLEALLLLVVVPGYGLLADRIEPSRLAVGVTGFFIVCLLVFRALVAARAPVGFAFFVWLGIFSTLSIAQLWSLANDLCSAEQGKRLFPFVALGGTIGAVVGAQIAARLIGPVGAPDLMWVASGLLAACLALNAALSARVARRGESADGRGGFRLVLGDDYLRLVALSAVALNVINTTGEYILAKMASGQAAGTANPEAFIGAFYGDFQTLVSVVTCLLQLVVVARLFRFIGIGRTVCVLPLAVLAGYGAFTLVPLLVVAEGVKVVENSGDYSINSTTQQALFLTTSRGAKYKAKAAIDTFFVRFGDLGATGLVFFGVRWGLGVRGFGLVNTGLAALWVGVAVLLARAWRRRAS
jgi:AAA family ATP:ADP antiporter